MVSSSVHLVLFCEALPPPWALVLRSALKAAIALWFGRPIHLVLCLNDVLFFRATFTSPDCLQSRFTLSRCFLDKVEPPSIVKSILNALVLSRSAGQAP